MLVDCEYKIGSKTLITSYVDKSGDIKLKHFKWDNPQSFVACEDTDPYKHQKFKSWDGKSVKLESSTRPDRYALYEFLDSLPQKEKETIFEYNLPKIFFVDIETEIIPEIGFPEASTAPTRILSISVVFDDKIILLGLRDMPEDMQLRIKDNTNQYFNKFGTEYKFKYVKYDSEYDMVFAFFNNMVPKMPVITGWNFLNYDWVYLCNRARKLGIDPAISSVTKRLNKVFMSDQEIPAHRMIFDYMQLYEICDTTIKVKESSSLDFVSKKLIGVDKIKYSGSLQKLYEDDFETFMYYNAVDSVLVQKIHQAKDYISIIYAISSLSKIKVVDVVSQANNALASLAITEGVLRERFRHEDIVLFRGERSDLENEGIAGGWVKDPVPGLNQWVVVYDFSSLYPHVQMQWFIAPENFVGVQDPHNEGYCLNGNKIDLNEHVVCVNGVVFRKLVSPTISMLQDVFMDRKKTKKSMMIKMTELDNVLKEIKQLEMEL